MNVARILIANDFSPQSSSALELGAELARRFHARVDVLHVFEPPAPPFGEAMLSVDAPRPLDELIHEQTAAEMHRCVRSLQRRGIEASGRVEVGDPAQLIVAHSDDYDLIVMGTHGRRGVARFINGSIAEAVVRRSSCPVLTARSVEEEVHHG